MKRLASALTFLLLLAGCDETTINNPAAPAVPVDAQATALASCGQNGAGLSIFCKDQSSDPHNRQNTASAG